MPGPLSSMRSHGAGSARGQGDAGGAGDRVVADGIVQQIAQRLPQQAGMSAYRHRFLAFVAQSGGLFQPFP